MRRRIAILCCGLSGLLGTAPAWSAMLVADLVGKARVGETVLTMLASVDTGHDLELAEGGRATLVDLVSGREYGLRGPGRYRVEAGGLRVLKGAPVDSATVATPHLPALKSDPQRLAQASFVMRDVRQAGRLEAPARNLIAVLPATLRWEPVPAATIYQIAVSDEQGQRLFAAHSTTPELALPPGLVSPGGRYRWRVEARAGERLLADLGQMFVIADAATIERLAAARAAAGGAVARRVLYALQLREAGAVTEARVEWRRLAAERPEEPRLRELAEATEEQ